MASTSEIRVAQARVAEAFRRKPGMALSTMKGTASLADGLLCRYRQGDHEAAMDMGTVFGGGGAEPTPGFYFRAAVSGCVAIGIKLTAAREGLDLKGVTIDVEMDFDDSAILGMGSDPAAPLATRLMISLKSSDDGGKLKAMVDRALAADPYYLALRDSQKVTTAVTLE